MNLIQRICEKYPIEYSLMPDFRIRTVKLTFGPQVPADLCDDVLDGLDRLGIWTDDTGLPMALNVSSVRPDSYTLTVSGEEMFHFSNYNGIGSPNYQISEAIIWVIYILASRKNWLDLYKGKFISCQCFSARQQAAAAQISGSVAHQFQANVSDKLTQNVFQELAALVEPFVMKAPRFSSRPVEDTVFEKAKGHADELTLLEIARRLFGKANFEDELTAYCQMVQHSNPFKDQIELATQRLVETAYNLPIMAVSHLFTEIGALIDAIDHPDFLELSARQQLLTEEVRFSLSAAALKNSFSKLDQAYLDGVRLKLQVLFLREVSDRAHALVNQELASARRNITQLRNALGRFCFVSQNNTDQDSEAHINWKKLSELKDRDIYSKDISWTPESFDDLQSSLRALYAPQLWICSVILRNQSQSQSITDILITQTAPIMDQRLVWAIWVDV